jgi:predicted nucleotidyltransferase
MMKRIRLAEETVGKLAAWAEASDCRLLVLFGSAASRKAERAKDVDLALSFSDLPDPERRLGLIGELQDLLEPRAVDVVFLHRDTDPVLRFEVFRNGVPVYESRPGLFIEEIVRAVALFEDSLPFRRALRRTFERTGTPT